MLLQMLSDCEFVRGMSAEAANRLESIAQVNSYSPGTLVFVEGTPHPRFHLIAQGHVRLEMYVPRRGRVPILTTGRGDVIAWSALIGDSTMTATGVALDAVTTVSFLGQELKQLCDAEQEVGYDVMRTLAAALSRRLLATRLQMLDLFNDGASTHALQVALTELVDPEC